jgi:hypothetical protein
MQLSFDRKELDRVLNPIHYTPKLLIDLFCRELPSEYHSRSYVWEESADHGKWRQKYTIAGHSERVLTQFSKYNSFNRKKLPINIVNNEFFKFILVLHDIGVYRAVKEGAASNKEADLAIAKKRGQHKYTKQYIQSILPQLQFSQSETNLAVAIISGDPIGGYLKQSIGRREASHQIKEMSDIAEIPIDQFFAVLTIFYICDASSYTVDGGGKKSLDFLFFNSHLNHTIGFDKYIENKINDLENNYIDKIAKGAIPIVSYKWYPMPVLPYWFQPDVLDSEIEKKEYYFAYRKNNGNYEVRLRSNNKLPALFDPNYGR